MSGGEFDYAFCRVNDFAERLQVKLDTADEVNEWGYQPNKFLPATMLKLQEIEQLARYTSDLMREAEWLYSGDTGDDSFQQRVAKIEAEYNKRKNLLVDNFTYCA